MLSIGPFSFSSPFVLAPLAGYTDLPFRILCREFGAGYAVSEMISCHGLCYQQGKTLAMLKSSPAERPVSFQLFGADPELMGKAAHLACQHAPDMVDINMGCPVKKVTKRGAGAALMGDIQLAESIIREVIQNSDVPVTVKFRAGTTFDQINCVEFAQMAEASGAAALTIHGRTWSQAFTGSSNRKYIRKVKEAVTVPVIGNGDVTSYQEGLEMMEETGCDGVMIGRAALGNPWVFTREGRPQTLVPILKTAQRHLQLMEDHIQVERALGYIKNHLGRYFKHMRGSSKIRQAIYGCPNYESLKQLIGSLQEA